jgi:hypothetical protein
MNVNGAAIAMTNPWIRTESSDGLTGSGGLVVVASGRGIPAASAADAEQFDLNRRFLTCLAASRRRRRQSSRVRSCVLW